VKSQLLASLLMGFLAVGLAQQSSTNPHAPAIAKWQALIPKIESLFEQRGYKCPAPPEESQMAIVDAADFHNGLSVALVDWCHGGAYTDWIVAMQFEGNEPVLSRFTKPNGKAEDVEFLQGASVMHGADVKLAPEKNAIYGIHWDNDQEMHLDCGANAYVWNRNTRAFRLDVELTKQATRTYCQKVQQQQQDLSGSS
jgi:hypothetical protein